MWLVVVVLDSTDVERSIITDHSIGECCHSIVFWVGERGPGEAGEVKGRRHLLSGPQRQAGTYWNHSAFYAVFPQELALFYFTKPQIGAHGLSRGSSAHIFVN